MTMSLQRPMLRPPSCCMRCAACGSGGRQHAVLIMGGEAYDGPPKFEVTFDGKVLGEGAVAAGDRHGEGGPLRRCRGQDAVCAELRLRDPRGRCSSRMARCGCGCSTRPMAGRLQPRPQSLSRRGHRQRPRRHGLGPCRPTPGRHRSRNETAGRVPGAPRRQRAGRFTGAARRLAAAADDCRGSRAGAADARDRRRVPRHRLPVPRAHRRDRTCGAGGGASRQRATTASGRPPSQRSKAASDAACDRSIEIYNVIGFNENSNDLTPRLMKRLDQIVADIGDEKCNVTVTGYSSKQGTHATNALFAVERAQNVAALPAAEGLQVREGHAPPAAAPPRSSARIRRQPAGGDHGHALSLPGRVDSSFPP